MQKTLEVFLVGTSNLQLKDDETIWSRRASNTIPSAEESINLPVPAPACTTETTSLKKRILQVQQLPAIRKD